jgi:hypothetical protein
MKHLIRKRNTSKKIDKTKRQVLNKTNLKNKKKIKKKKKKEAKISSMENFPHP